MLFTAATKAWMTGELFKEYVDWLDRKMRLANRKVALVVDNCPAHIEFHCTRMST